jgi:hypothetical protein
MSPGLPRVAGHGLAADADQAAGLAQAVALGDVVQDGHGPLPVQMGAEEGCALALGEAGLAGAAVEHPALLIGPGALADTEVSGAALAGLGAVGIEAAEPGEVVHMAGALE